MFKDNEKSVTHSKVRRISLSTDILLT